jgi:hypothetical protein
MVNLSDFAGRKMVIATKHRKEWVIGPVLKKALDVTYFSADSLDTDLFGTFSGEFPRTSTPIDAARAKCHAAMDLYNVDLAIASEGSFGPHPALFFVPAAEEYLVFMDRANELEISVKKLSSHTNYASLDVRSNDKLDAFLQRVQFPSHALLAKPSATDFTSIVKGISSVSKLYSTIDFFIKKYGTCQLETDMRAMMNPTRMQVIKELTHKLVEKINSTCPACHFPGFDVTEVERGLICEYCHCPTDSIQGHIYTCKRCHFTQEKKYPQGKRHEDPSFCKNCNP